MYQLRDYQRRALEDARTAFARGTRRSLIVAPTGAGKTVIACALIESATRKGSKTLFLAHRIELIEQTSRKLRDLGIEHGIIKAGISTDRVRPNALVQVAAVQTLDRRREGLEKYSVVIVDEAHHAKAESWTRVIQATQCDALLGLTATPYRSDGKALGDHFDKLIVVASLEELISAGHLVEARVYGREPPDLHAVKRLGNDYNLKQLAQVMDQAALVDDIVSEWQRLAAGRTTVVFATSIAHSQHIAAAFERAGIPAGHVDGEMPMDERAAVLQRLALGEIRVVSNCAILTEGWDLPRCSAVVLARPTQSRSLWKQMCGRALRPYPEEGKKDCLIIDHAGCWKRHGFLTDPEQLSLKGRELRESSAPRSRCDLCGAEFPGWPRFCPECGKELVRKQGRPLEVAQRSGEQLVEVGPIRDERQFFHELLLQARAEGKEPGVATRSFKARVGEWPSNGIYPQQGPTQLVWAVNDDGRKLLKWRLPLTITTPTSRSLLASPRPMATGAYARDLVRERVSCPACRAGPGSPCVGERGQLRKANHAERVSAATRLNPPAAGQP